MSLINQALRKAQRDRTPNRMAQPGEPNPAAYAPSGSSGMRPALVIGLIIVVAVLIGLVAGLSIVIFKGDDDAAPTNLASSLPTAPTSPVDPQITPPAASKPSAPMVPMAASTPSTPDIVDELRRARVASEAAAAAQAETAAQQSENIIQWLSRATVSGVRLSERENRVLLNGKAYAEGEFVNYTLGLKVLVIQETRILFVDQNDKKYMKRL